MSTKAKPDVTSDILYRFTDIEGAFLPATAASAPKRDRADKPECDTGNPCGGGCISSKKTCRSNQRKSGGGSLASPAGDRLKADLDTDKGKAVLAATGLVVAAGLAGVAGAALLNKKKGVFKPDVDSPELVDRHKRFTARMDELTKEIGQLQAKREALKAKWQATRKQEDWENYSCAHLDVNLKSDEWFNLHFNLVADEYDTKQRRAGRY